MIPKRRSPPARARFLHREAALALEHIYVLRAGPVPHRKEFPGRTRKEVVDDQAVKSFRGKWLCLPPEREGFMENRGNGCSYVVVVKVALAFACFPCTGTWL